MGTHHCGSAATDHSECADDPPPPRDGDTINDLTKDLYGDALTAQTDEAGKSARPESDILEEISRRLGILEGTDELLVETNYGGRARALDQLEFAVLDPLAGLRANIEQPATRPESGAVDMRGLDDLADRAVDFRRELEKRDSSYLETLRTGIRDGLRGGALRAVLDGQVVGRNRMGNSPGYEALDAFISDLILSVPAPAALFDREPEMVFYQPTPARIILELIDKATFGTEDHFVDVGSGLGLVPIMVNLLSGVRATGIEIDPSYHRYAVSRARALELDDIHFVNADAREADFRDGTAFFLYTPFTGQLLQDVLHRIRSQRQGRQTTLFSFGPCTEAVASQPWLEPIGRVDDEHALATFRTV